MRSEPVSPPRAGFRFQALINQQDMHRRLVLSPVADHTLAEWARHHPPQAITLIIGPEGGLSEQEFQLAIGQGAIPLSMGPRILRTETAGLNAMATLNSHWGDL